MKYFPESKEEFNLFKDQVHLFTKTLYENYIGCYIKKEKPLKEWAYQYRTHMYNLHQQYLIEINNKNKKYHISFSRVIDYFNLLHPAKQMFALNYNMRKRNLDHIQNVTDISLNQTG